MDISTRTYSIRLKFQQWELMVLNVLHWDLSSVTSYSILDNILRRTAGSSPNAKLYSSEISTIRRHAETFVALAATEPDFMGYSPAAISGASLGTAIRGLNSGCYGKNTLENSGQLNGLLTHLQALTNADKVRIDAISRKRLFRCQGLIFIFRVIYT